MTTTLPGVDELTDLQIFNELDERLAERCEFQSWLACPVCPGAPACPKDGYEIDKQCDRAAQWMVVVKNCGNFADCSTRERCAHALCTIHRDMLASGNLVLPGVGKVQVVSCEPIRK